VLILRLRGHVDNIALTSREVVQLIGALEREVPYPAAETVAHLLEDTESQDPVAFPLTDLESQALGYALDGLRATEGELSNGLALLRQEVQSDN
jgi:hypothetical protein